MDVFQLDTLAPIPHAVHHYRQRLNWRKQLLRLLFLCIPLFLFSGNAIASCSHDLTYTIPTSHIRYDGECSSEQTAMSYCVALAAKHGYPSTYCGRGGTAATRYYVSGGWFSDLWNVRKMPFHWVTSYYTGPSVKPYKNQGAPGCPDQCIGDPINVGTGNKFESRVEYASPDGMLQLSWTYNWLFSKSYTLPATLIFGAKRTHYYGRSVMRMDSATPAVAWVSRPDGNSLRFSLSDESWLGSDGTGDILRELRQAGIFIGWELTDAAGDIEVYDEKGQLILLQPKNGNDQFLFYSLGLLARVEDEHGGKLVFEYNASKLVSRVVLPDGNAILFKYSSALYLTEVEYSPDSRIKYLYDEVGYVAGINSAKGALTGVIDEAGQRRSSTWYDTGNRAFATEEGSSGTQRSAATYASASTGTYVSSTTASLPSGHTRAMTFAPVNGIVLPTRTTITCNGCITSATTYTYDSAGKPDVVTRDGVATDYDYDESGRLIRKVEAANFATSRRTSLYRWNDSLPLLAERQLLDSSDAVVKRWTWQYNARGQAVEATISDPASGVLRVVSSTYCEQDDVEAGSCPITGLITSIDGSRTDMADVTHYVYYAGDHVDCASSPYSCPYRRGDLAKVVGPLGHVVEYLRYDGGRRVLSVKDANGVITDMEYHPRGWLAARKVRGADDASESDDRITRIEYEPTGLIRKTTLPDGNYTSFAYDAAHRLTDITDGEGNRTHYTLDNAGNKTREDTIGQNGTVMRTLSRVFNQLGQLQTSKDAYDRGTSFTYDANGNTDTVADALGRVTDSGHDPLNRLTQTIQDLGGINATTQFEYDAQDNLTAVVDPKSLATRYTYNAL
ncbi:MAG: RHS repeat protein, partial [Lysobacter sp.]|nr:RHS repeat protein [Lysobacter sp.]